MLFATTAHGKMARTVLNTLVLPNEGKPGMRSITTLIANTAVAWAANSPMPTLSTVPRIFVGSVGRLAFYRKSSANRLMAWHKIISIC